MTFSKSVWGTKKKLKLGYAKKKKQLDDRKKIQRDEKIIKRKYGNDQQFFERRSEIFNEKPNFLFPNHIHSNNPL